MCVCACVRVCVCVCVLLLTICTWRCSWNHFGCDISEALIHAQTEAFVRYLAPAGYEYMNLGAIRSPLSICSKL